MTAWNDFNDAEQQQTFDLIPKGTVARVRMTIKPGGYDDPVQGWTGGYATQSFETGSVYLACEFVVLEGEYARRKMWSNVGLHSPKGPAWGNMGRSFVRAALNSARHGRSSAPCSPKPVPLGCAGRHCSTSCGGRTRPPARRTRRPGRPSRSRNSAWRIHRSSPAPGRRIRRA